MKMTLAYPCPTNTRRKNAPLTLLKELHLALRSDSDFIKRLKLYQSGNNLRVGKSSSLFQAFS